MNKNIVRLIFPLLALALAGCDSNLKVESQVDPDADLSGVKTYTILPLPTQIPGAEPGLAIRLGATVKEALNAGLQAKGLSPAAADKADLAVRVHGKVVPKIDVTDWGYSGYYGVGYHRRGHYGWAGAYPSGGTDVDQYEEGTIVIEIYSRESKQMVWVGWGTGRRSSKGPDPEKVNAAVMDIIARYPTSS
jgi:hypothetical protein